MEVLQKKAKLSLFDIFRRFQIPALSPDYLVDTLFNKLVRNYYQRYQATTPTPSPKIVQAVAQLLYSVDRE